MRMKECVYLKGPHLLLFSTALYESWKFNLSVVCGQILASLQDFCVDIPESLHFRVR